MSFDVEFARKYKARVVLVDPTPRAVEHYEKVVVRMGRPRGAPYSEASGTQKPESYELTKLEGSQFTFVPLAMARYPGKTVKLFPPKNPNHVSFSALDLQRTRRRGAPTLDSQTTSVVKLLQSEDFDYLVLKLDVEGAALGVLKGSFENGVFPNQILLEIDELFFRSIRNLFRARRLLWLLRRNAYRLRGFKDADVCFELSS